MKMSEANIGTSVRERPRPYLDRCLRGTIVAPPYQVGRVPYVQVLLTSGRTQTIALCRLEKC